MKKSEKGNLAQGKDKRRVTPLKNCPRHSFKKKNCLFMTLGFTILVEVLMLKMYLTSFFFNFLIYSSFQRPKRA